MKRIALAVCLFALLIAPALADLQEGLAAYKRGDFATALRELRSAARPVAKRASVEGSGTGDNEVIVPDTENKGLEGPLSPNNVIAVVLPH